MNNSWFQDEPEIIQANPEEEARLTRIIEAIVSLYNNQDWQTLQELVFSTEEKRLESRILSESFKDKLEPEQIYRLQGELKWARRYADLAKYGKHLKSKLDKLKHG